MKTGLLCFVLLSQSKSARLVYHLNPLYLRVVSHEVDNVIIVPVSVKTTLKFMKKLQNSKHGLQENM